MVVQCIIQVWVEWYGDRTVSLVDKKSLQTLEEGWGHRKKKKVPPQLSTAVEEAFKDLEVRDDHVKDFKFKLRGVFLAAENRKEDKEEREMNLQL